MVSLARFPAGTPASLTLGTPFKFQPGSKIGSRGLINKAMNPSGAHVSFPEMSDHHWYYIARSLRGISLAAVSSATGFVRPICEGKPLETLGNS